MLTCQLYQADYQALAWFSELTTDLRPDLVRATHAWTLVDMRDMSDVGRNHLATGLDKIQRVHPTPKTPAFALFKVEFLQFKIKSVSQGYYWLSDSDPRGWESGSYVLFQNHQPRPTKPLSLFEIV